MTFVPFKVGQSIPPDTPHAVSVSLPTWKACVDYEEGEERVLSSMKNGYPRFFVDRKIAALADAVVKCYGEHSETAFLFPSHAVAARCVRFLWKQTSAVENGENVRIVDFFPCSGLPYTQKGDVDCVPMMTAVLFPAIQSKFAKSFWQHSGDGISSRRAELCHKAFNDGFLVVKHLEEKVAEVPPRTFSDLRKGPRRYQKEAVINPAQATPEVFDTDSSVPKIITSLDGKEYVQFIEERYGRNLDSSLAAKAKMAIRRRIAGALTTDIALRDALNAQDTPTHTRQVPGLSEQDVHLYPTGMSSIFNTHRTVLACRGAMKSISYGFPYIDTLKVLQKWGPGCLFYGNGSSTDLDDLERRCRDGERYLALFCEFPGNPLLKSPDLARIRSLADCYDFAVIVDETVGNFLNIHVLPYADVVVSSLTKVFSGDSNVMGGSSVLNPNGRYYQQLRKVLSVDYEDNYWAEDAIFMERNSRDFVSRIERINLNAESICDTLNSSLIVKKVYYPKHGSTRAFYDFCRTPNGGYGGLLSVTFNSTAEAVVFFDALETAKGPSLGTNFTLSCPYTLLAHYGELEWAAQFGVEVDLVRISVGLEGAADLSARIERALDSVARTKSQ